MAVLPIACYTSIHLYRLLRRICKHTGLWFVRMLAALLSNKLFVFINLGEVGVLGELYVLELVGCGS